MRPSRDHDGSGRVLPGRILVAIAAAWIEIDPSDPGWTDPGPVAAVAPEGPTPAGRLQITRVSGRVGAPSKPKRA